MLGWWNGGLVEWRIDGMVDWRNGGFVECWIGGMVDWWIGGLVECWIGGMEEWWNATDTRESSSTGRETCHSVSLHTTNLTRTGLVSNTGLCGARPARSPLKTKSRLNYIYRCSSYRAVNILHLSPSGPLHHSLLYPQGVVTLLATSVNVNIQTCSENVLCW